MFAEGMAKEAYDVVTQFSTTDHLIIKTGTEWGAVLNVVVIKSPHPQCLEPCCHQVPHCYPRGLEPALALQPQDPDQAPMKLCMD